MTYLASQPRKFLGITIDESLYWQKHLSRINSKISRALFLIKQVQFSLPVESSHTLYFALLHPHLLYRILSWENAKSNTLNKSKFFTNEHSELYTHKNIIVIPIPYLNSRVTSRYQIYIRVANNYP